MQQCGDIQMRQFGNIGYQIVFDYCQLNVTADGEFSFP